MDRHFGTIQQVLRGKEGDPNLKLTSVDEREICELGDGYTAIVVSAKISYTTGEGRQDEVRWILKKPFEDAALNDLVASEKAFINETVWYTELMAEYKNGFDATNCFYASTELIILEDLGAMGFRKPCRLKGLDDRHLETALKQLAKIHASSMRLRQDKSERFNEIVSKLEKVRSDGEFFRKVFALSLKRAARKLEQLDMGASARRLREYTAEAFLQQPTASTEDEFFSVVCHGDYWLNNMFFKCGNSGKLEIRVIDFQCVQLGPAARDVLTLIETSSELKCVDSEWLFSVYYLALRSALEGPDDMPAFDTFLRHIENNMVYGFLVGVFYITAVVIQKDHGRHLESITRDDFFSEDFTVIENSREYSDRLVFLVNRYKLHGLV